jgi:hypothetical protein
VEIFWLPATVISLFQINSNRTYKLKRKFIIKKMLMQPMIYPTNMQNINLKYSIAL